MLYYFKVVFIILLTGFILISCKTYNVTCQWQHSTPTLVKGFKIHLGRYSQQYTYVLDLGFVEPTKIENGIGEYSLTQKVSDRLYKQYRYCAMTAYNDQGQSSYSNEVAWSSISGLNFNAIPQIKKGDLQ